MSYDGVEKRKNLRIGTNLIVSYRQATEKDLTDISQTKNIGLGGAMFKTKKEFPVGTNLMLEIRLPQENVPFMFIGKVMGSKQVIKDLCYDTRIEFLSVNETQKNAINALINYLSKKDDS